MSKLDKIVGKTVAEIRGMEKDSEKAVIIFSDGSEVIFYHEQSCCEHVRLVDFECDAKPGALIISAEEVADHEFGGAYGSLTWTFYKIETNKGEIWMRWLGESNGCYSESVDIRVKEGSK